jgi:X-X-X-Leu-X-X-Gly heptad repeat protein
MKVSLTDAGKRFNRDWIFRHFTYTFEKVILMLSPAPMAPGKSTLLQVLSGSMQLSEGNGQWSTGNGQLANEEVYKQVSLCAPYLEVVEEMTSKEFLEFHHHF